MSVIQAFVATASHGQFTPVVTLTRPVAEPEPCARFVGESEYVQMTAACVTTRVWSAMEMKPTRSVSNRFSATAYETVPLPLFVEAERIVSQELVVEGVQVQPASVATLTEPVAAFAVKDCCVGVSAYTHGAASCVMVKICPSA